MNSQIPSCPRVARIAVSVLIVVTLVVGALLVGILLLVGMGIVLKPPSSERAAPRG